MITEDLAKMKESEMARLKEAIEGNVFEGGKIDPQLYELMLKKMSIRKYLSDALRAGGNEEILKNFKLKKQGLTEEEY
jgi:hypothetical protein